MNIIIKGQIRGGKNNMGVTRSGLHYPKKNWSQWRDQAVMQVRLQMPRIGSEIMAAFEIPMALTATYTPGDRLRRDATALLDSIFHVLERSGIIKDDSQFKMINWEEKCPDKMNAGIKLTISPKGICCQRGTV